MSNSAISVFATSFALPVCVILAGCGGGGGGGGSAASGLSQITNAPSASYSDGSLTYSISANGDEIKWSTKVSEVHVNGVKQDSDSFAGLEDDLYKWIDLDGMVYTEGEKSKAFAIVKDADDYLFNSEEIEARSETGGWAYEGVKYKYAVGIDGAKPALTQAKDGQINYDGSSWSATFGDVSLKGSVSGYNVSGSATLDDMNGSFKGYDGEIISTGPNAGPDSFGGFAGDDGEGSAFAGRWETWNRSP